MLSLSLCDDCHRGSPRLWFHTMADNNRTDGQMAMHVHQNVCVRWACVCVHLHAWVCRESRGACLWSLPVQWSSEVSERWQQFNRGRGKIWERWSPFQNKVQKITENPLYMWPEQFCTWKILTPTELQIRFQHSFTQVTVSFKMSPFSHFLLPHFSSASSSFQLFWHLFCYSLCLHLFFIASPFYLQISFIIFTPLFFYFHLPTVFLTNSHSLTLTSRPLVACLSIFHPWVPLQLKKPANCNRRQ